ncbi:CPBP family glutamic-type intramembrane protease [Psychroserpens damuponensis]|uniref:CPBP family glutamic-type intramembrane protease n=1 Tax=Psychroserpens damuponensis TaxID=943936 RepID=UPI00058F11FA|nr:CPBP family glutamic-type intramembrane protease [Psychroserpens damuponensis]
MNKFIAQAFKVEHDFWKYLMGSMIVFIAAIVGQFPLLGAVIIKVIQDGGNLQLIDESSMYSLLDSNVFLLLALLSFAVGFIGLYLAVKFIHKQKMTAIATSRSKLDWKRIWFAFFFWGILSSALVLVDYFYLAPDGYVYNFEMQRFIILAVIAIALIPIQTSLEEYLFRGYLMQGFGVATTDKFFPFAFLISLITIPMFIIVNIKYTIGYLQNSLLLIAVITVGIIVFQIIKKTNGFESQTFNSLRNICQRNWSPLLITSAIFGLLHIANPEIGKLGYSLLIYYIGTGLFLGIMTLMDEGTELALGFHAANNLFTALLVTSDWTAFQTHSILKDIAEPKLELIDMVVPVFIMFPIILFVFSKVYKWTNWKEKLFGKIEEPPKDDYKIIG